MTKTIAEAPRTFGVPHERIGVNVYDKCNVN